MLPLFGADDASSKRRRQINLGGTSSGASQASLLEQAKARRDERDAQRRKHDAAVRIQSWWRGYRDSRTVRNQLKEVVRNDTKGISGLRALVLIGRDGEALSIWATAMDSPETLLGPLRGIDAGSWRTLLPRASLLLLQSVSSNPQSANASQYIRILGILMSTPTVTSVLGSDEIFTAVVSGYLLQHGLYPLISGSIGAIPVSDKASLVLPSLISLSIAPLTTFSPGLPTSSPSLYITSFTLLLTHLLAVPLLPNRLPLPSLTLLSKSIPFAALHHVLPHVTNALQSTPINRKIHLLANLLAFVPPRYSALPPIALAAYLDILAQLLGTVPPNSLEPPSSDKAAAASASASSWAVDSDDDVPIRVQRVSTFSTSDSQAVLSSLDSRTVTRLGTITSSSHLRSLVSAAKTDARPALATFLLSLNAAWPARRTRVLSAVLAQAGGGLVRELYRGWVRGSPLGRDETGSALSDEKNAASWPPLLLLVDLYTHALLTMHDDEFFSSSHGLSGFVPSSTPAAAGATADAVAAAKNPLTLDELTSFSRQLLNVVFPLYWRDDSAEGGGKMSALIPGTPGVTWAAARERITECLQAIHARDSRKKFTPPDHWLVTSEIDVQLFVQAALFEADKLEEEDVPTTRPPPRTASKSIKRQAAAYGPRLGVLNNIPFAVPFEVRVAVFRGWVSKDMRMHAGLWNSSSPMPINPMDRWERAMMGGNRRSKTHAVVRRGHIAEDGFDKLGEADLKAPIAITFMDQWGNEEAGIDGGGVFKEFFTSLCKEVFDTDRGLWLANRVNELYPNPHGYATEAHSLNWYRFIGRILGKALYEGILVEVAFAPFFLAKWLGRQSFLDDLASLDPDLYQGLIFLKHYTGDPEELALNFTVAIEEFGETKSIDLIPNGSNIPVTRENRLQYIYLVSHFRLTRQIRRQSDAFFEGLSDIVDTKWLRMFNQQELQVLLGGVNAPVDIDDLRANTTYGGLYDNEHAIIEAFWRIVASFNQEERRKLLKFVTSCSRPPLLGFKELYPQFAIRDAGGDENRLPTSSTCVNLLKLPRYSSEQIMRTKLLQAINSNAGFDLS